jgi:hypothetical protein
MVRLAHYWVRHRHSTNATADAADNAIATSTGRIELPPLFRPAAIIATATHEQVDTKVRVPYPTSETAEP